MLLYAVTDRSWVNGRTLEEQVEAAIKGGATCIQLREKELSYNEFLKEAIKIKRITDKYNVPFFINDQVKVAIACDADGIHIGQGDLPIITARNMIGPKKILGVSAHTIEEAIMAEQEGADYLGVGAVYSTSTKLNVNTVSMDTIKEICKTISIPVVAIGGINERNILQLSGSGVDGVAVVSAVFAADDIIQASQKILALSKQMVSE